MIDVVALGELLIDFAPVLIDDFGYPTLKAQPGGAPGNFLAALQEYGCSTALLGKVGEDDFGRLLVSTLRDHGVETRGIVTDGSVFTTMAFVTLDSAGDRSFSFARKPGADCCLRKEELDFSLIDACRVFHFGTLSMTDEPARTATQAAVAYAKKRGKLLSFDPNLRTSLWANEEAAKEQIEWGLRQADIVKISEEEIAFLWGISPETGAQKLLSDYDVRLVYATLGPKGCHFANAQGCGEVGSPWDVRTVDTTGAGDIFGGSAMSQFLRLSAQPEELSVEQMRTVTRFACCAASLSTRTHGGISSIVSEKEVRSFLQ